MKTHTEYLRGAPILGMRKYLLDTAPMEQNQYPSQSRSGYQTYSKSTNELRTPIVAIRHSVELIAEGILVNILDSTISHDDLLSVDSRLGAA